MLSTSSPFLLTLRRLQKVIRYRIPFIIWYVDIESSRIHCRHKKCAYYKDDERNPNKVSNLFVLAGAVLFIPVVLTLLATVPGLEAINAVVINIISSFSRGLEMYLPLLAADVCRFFQAFTSYARKL